MDMNPWILDLVTMILLGVSGLSLIRVVIGPTVEDRMIGLNLLLPQVSAILVLVATRVDRPVYLDVALVYVILSFIGILALARYLEREDEE